MNTLHIPLTLLVVASVLAPLFFVSGCLPACTPLIIAGLWIITAHLYKNHEHRLMHLLTNTTQNIRHKEIIESVIMIFLGGLASITAIAFISRALIITIGFAFWVAYLIYVHAATPSRDIRCSYCLNLLIVPTIGLAICVSVMVQHLVC